MRNKNDEAHVFYKFIRIVVNYVFFQEQYIILTTCFSNFKKFPFYH